MAALEAGAVLPEIVKRLGIDIAYSNWEFTHFQGSTQTVARLILDAWLASMSLFPTLKAGLLDFNKSTFSLPSARRPTAEYPGSARPQQCLTSEVSTQCPTTGLTTPIKKTVSHVVLVTPERDARQSLKEIAYP